MTRLLLLASLSLAAPAAADVPRVVTDIAPVHGLVSRVMEGLGAPELILRPGASPHGYAMRPSEAGALEAADVVFWVGPELTPWLDRPLETLAGGAQAVALLSAEGLVARDYRSETVFAPDDHHAHEGEDEHAHDDGHADDDMHGHDDEHADAHGDGDEDAHGDGDEDAHGHEDAHDHGDGLDPHAWLDPENGKLWLDAIAAALSAADPENAAAYAANAAAGRAEIDEASAAIAARLQPHIGAPYVVFHDAYQYFEARFGLSPVGAISVSDASSPGPARLAEIREAIVEARAACVFAETQFPQKLVDTVLEGTAARLAVIDPLGAELAQGPGFYPALLTDLAGRMADCLG